MTVLFAVLVVIAVSALLWIGLVIVPVVQAERRRQQLARERALAEARIQWHTHQAMRRMYEIVRQAQSAPPKDLP